MLFDLSLTVIRAGRTSHFVNFPNVPARYATLRSQPTTTYIIRKLSRHASFPMVLTMIPYGVGVDDGGRQASDLFLWGKSEA
jgi:hypothetical protein